MDKIVPLEITGLLLSYLFIVVLLIIVRVRKIDREKEILISCFKMTIQLVIAGHLLVYLFEYKNPFLTLLTIGVMESFAVYTVFKRVKVKLSEKLKKNIILSLVGGSLIGVFYFLLIVVGPTPWYDPRYFIPISGMLIGNAMTGVALAVNRIVDGVNTQKSTIENSLMLGATPKDSLKEIMNKSFDAAILPTINSMIGMGIVSLPGMMTGQILSGTSPLTAIEYQISIMLGISGSVALSVIIFVQFGYKCFFNERAQLESN